MMYLKKNLSEQMTQNQTIPVSTIPKQTVPKKRSNSPIKKNLYLWNTWSSLFHTKSNISLINPLKLIGSLKATVNWNWMEKR